MADIEEKKRKEERDRAEKQMKDNEEAKKKANVHDTISKHLLTGKSLESIYFQACINGAVISVEDILDRGVDLGSHYTQAGSPQWWTALHLAAANGRDEVVRILVDAGMDVNIETSA